jgi:rhodanese-related sulfurtransferase
MLAPPPRRAIFPAMQTAGLALLLVLLLALVAVFLGSRSTSVAGPPATLTPRAGSPGAADAPAVTTRIEHVDGPGAARLLARTNLTVLDLRTPAEYAAGHLDGARLIDYNSPQFAEELARLDREQLYLVHCASGRRSTAALETFRQLGFKHIIHLDGGLRAWQAAGNPVVK